MNPVEIGIYVIWGIMAIVIVYSIVVSISSSANLKLITKSTEKLANEINDKTVLNYIDMAKNVKIPRSSRAWHSLKSAYELVKCSEQVSPSVKKELKNVLLGKGVSLRS